MLKVIAYNLTAEVAHEAIHLDDSTALRYFKACTQAVDASEAVLLDPVTGEVRFLWSDNEGLQIADGRPCGSTLEEMETAYDFLKDI